MRDISHLGHWDEDEGFHCIPTRELGLPRASRADDTEFMALYKEWHHGQIELAEPEDVPLSDIDASIQGVLRRDVLEFYLSGPIRTYDKDPSSWGASGPLAARLSDGRNVLVDGNHRWAAAHLRGEKTFRAQILQRR
jgi:hypothetical protein